MCKSTWTQDGWGAAGTNGRVKFLLLAWVGIPKTSYSKNSDSLDCLLFRQAQSAALQDKLTGLNNRGAFDISLKREIYLAHRQHIPMSLLVIYIDYFKSVNDTYGHSSGDLAP